MPVDIAPVVYECSGCGRSTPSSLAARDCNLFCRRLAPGGRCPSCGEVVLVEELEEG
jgi:DNA-directed RNA polymerase subunit RPC12/RpoP